MSNTPTDEVLNRKKYFGIKIIGDQKSYVDHSSYYNEARSHQISVNLSPIREVSMNNESALLVGGKIIDIDASPLLKPLK